MHDYEQITLILICALRFMERRLHRHDLKNQFRTDAHTSPDVFLVFDEDLKHSVLFSDKVFLAKWRNFGDKCIEFVTLAFTAVLLDVILNGPFGLLGTSYYKRSVRGEPTKTSHSAKFRLHHV
jgi:hypothetical protein